MRWLLEAFGVVRERTSDEIVRRELDRGKSAREAARTAYIETGDGPYYAIAEHIERERKR